MVMGTLMNLCDHPERASLGESWREDKTLRRVPIIVTGNDLSTLYAPLLRDGRMSKFLWTPSREDIVGMVLALYRDDGLCRDDVCALVDAFPGQPLDFFGAVRAKRYDAAIREWAAALGSEKEMGKRLIAALRAEEDGAAVEGLPDFAGAESASLASLLADGAALAEEQERVLTSRLSDTYMRKMAPGIGARLGLQG